VGNLDGAYRDIPFTRPGLQSKLKKRAYGMVNHVVVYALTETGSFLVCVPETEHKLPAATRQQRHKASVIHFVDDRSNRDT
jgi:hypothetical protein